MYTLGILRFASDPDGDSLKITDAYNPQPSGSTINYTPNAITYMAPADYYGSGSFKFTLDDSKGGIVAITVPITIKDLSAGPIGNNPTYGPTVIGNEYVVRFAIIPNTEYTIQHSKSGSTAHGSWSKYINITTPPNGQIEVRESEDAPSAGYYRVIHPPY